MHVFSQPFSILHLYSAIPLLGDCAGFAQVSPHACLAQKPTDCSPPASSPTSSSAQAGAILAFLVWVPSTALFLLHPCRGIIRGRAGVRLTYIICCVASWIRFIGGCVPRAASWPDSHAQILSLSIYFRRRLFLSTY